MNSQSLKLGLPLLLTLVMGCYAASPDASSGPDAEGAQTATDPREDGWRACVLDRPVCVEAVYCDASADDDPRCFGHVLNACVVRPVSRGAECFDGAIGHCDGRGACT